MLWRFGTRAIYDAHWSDGECLECSEALSAYPAKILFNAFNPLFWVSHPEFRLAIWPCDEERHRITATIDGKLGESFGEWRKVCANLMERTFHFVSCRINASAICTAMWAIPSQLFGMLCFDSVYIVFRRSGFASKPFIALVASKALGVSPNGGCDSCIPIMLFSTVSYLQQSVNS